MSIFKKLLNFLAIQAYLHVLDVYPMTRPAGCNFSRYSEGLVKDNYTMYRRRVVNEQFVDYYWKNKETKHRLITRVDIKTNKCLVSY